MHEESIDHSWSISYTSKIDKLSCRCDLCKFSDIYDLRTKFLTHYHLFYHVESLKIKGICCLYFMYQKLEKPLLKILRSYSFY